MKGLEEKHTRRNVLGKPCVIAALEPVELSVAPSAVRNDWLHINGFDNSRSMVSYDLLTS